MKRGFRLCRGVVSCVVPMLLAGACGEQGKSPDKDEAEQAQGNLSVSVPSLSQQDVSAVQFKVQPPGAACDAPPIAESTVALASDTLSTSGSQNFYAQTLFVLAAGTYRVCMVPLTSTGTPSSMCTSTASLVPVSAGATTSLVLTSQCQGSPSGAIAVTGVLNQPPQILDVRVDTSDANPCQQARIAVKAGDPNHDSPLQIFWSATGAGPVSVDGEEQAVLRTNTAGNYNVTITVRDTHDAETSLTIPIHVSESALARDVCEITPDVDTYVRTDLDVRRDDNYGCNPLLEVGTSRGGGGQPLGSADAMRIVLGFPTILPPGATVQSAVLEMTVAGYEAGGSVYPFRLDIHRNVGNRPQEGNGIENMSEGQLLFDAPTNCVWVDQADRISWAGRGTPTSPPAPAFNATVLSSATVDPVTQGKGAVVRWDITSLAREWFSDSSTNSGITITDITSNGEFRGIIFGSREQIFGFPAQYASAAPRLVVTLAR